MQTKITIIAALVILAAGFSGCGNRTEREAEVRHNQLTEEEKAEGWELLFDGRTTSGWRGFQKDDLTIDEGWYAHQGQLVSSGIDGGNIVHERKFRNFIFTTDWRISEGGNSGIFYLVGENGYGAPYDTGPEYQLLDDMAYSELDGKHATGANYDLHAPSDAPVKPAGEWNTATIVVDNGKVEHWLNGQKVVEYELWTEEWENLVASSKWAHFPGYGQYREGLIGLQDHGDVVWFRNIKIKVLD